MNDSRSETFELSKPQVLEVIVESIASVTPVFIRGIGHALGDQPLNNQQLMTKLGIKVKSYFVEKYVGIEQRNFISDNRSLSDIATEAARSALRDADMSIDQIDCLILATSTADYLSPSTACIVQHQLQGKNFPAFDISAACSGFMYAMDIAQRFIRTGCRNVLIIGADVRSRTLDASDKKTAFLYGDGAGAMVISGEPNPAGFGKIIDNQLFANGEAHELVFVPSVGAKNHYANINKVNKLQMQDGKKIARQAIEGIKRLSHQILERNHFSLNDINHFVFHQPNYFLLKAAIEQLDIDINKAVINFTKIGNTVAGSIPIAFSQAYQKSRFKPGDLILTCAIGAGYTGGACLIRWESENE